MGMKPFYTQGGLQSRTNVRSISRLETSHDPRADDVERRAALGAVDRRCGADAAD
jgi:hypothetical protein